MHLYIFDTFQSDKDKLESRVKNIHLHIYIVLYMSSWHSQCKKSKTSKCLQEISSWLKHFRVVLSPELPPWLLHVAFSYDNSSCCWQWTICHRFHSGMASLLCVFWYACEGPTSYMSPLQICCIYIQLVLLHFCWPPYVLHYGLEHGNIWGNHHIMCQTVFL